MNDCLFCKIASGDIPSEKIYEDDDTFAFLDISPVNPGHTLVIPKIHTSNVYEISEKSWTDVMKTVKKLSEVLKESLSADGINIEMNNEVCAGQVVFHAHVHIIPRFENDGVKHWPQKPATNTEQKEVAEQIRKTLP